MKAIRKSQNRGSYEEPSSNRVSQNVTRRQNRRWFHGLNALIGLWLLAAPFMLAYESNALIRSDLLSGAVIFIFSITSLFSRNIFPPWIVSFAGLWLLFAPLIFWAPAASIFINDTLAGSLVIAFAMIIPGIPGKKMVPLYPENPPGWDYNPSEWLQRAPIIALAFVGFFISAYLAFYQLGYIPFVWDPFFKDGTKNVLESDVSKAWPVSDAGLGAVSYLLEVLSGFMGDTRRWRSMPWMVVVFGILVIPVGVVSIVLVILQPLAVGFWCTLCLITAVAMLIMVSPALDEVIATGQFLIQARREGKPFWRTFFKGDTLTLLEEKPRKKPSKSVLSETLSALSLNTIPWNLLISAILGIWLIVSPYILAAPGYEAHHEQIIGALIVTFSVIAIGEVSRSVRFLNMVLGLWIIAAGGFFFVDSSMSLNNGIVGTLAILLNLRRGAVKERHGSWDKLII